ncbi:1-acyl-sn-glycerol-3-phosphate acyltransferase BAT2, chloroplastic isoform X2 [Diospyros lotus]|uniref:1-acyl-sn-glycerol-3-phosphate acyltransferase BAT2, chloroplastic isoform X2 n=1 Tax=Diospyros lotus TaxID=55363 RepID=UPI002251BD53|nr:1-acyl-sn-glycerol-3-phosphate acyltransferase BAT2, chloroplastic isoform X2 [Diospyros lotus]
MEVSSPLKPYHFFSRPLNPLRLCRQKEARLHFPISIQPRDLQLCIGLHLGSFPVKQAISRKTINYMPDSTIFSPRNCTKATWCSFNPEDKVARFYHDSKLHNRDRFARRMVVKSELVGTGTPDAAYSLSEPHVLSKIRGICFYGITAVVAIILFVLMLVAHPFVLLFDQYHRKAHHLVAKIWALATVTPFFNIKFEGLENIPVSDAPAVYVSNHQSFLDIYTLLTLGRTFKFISKTSIFLFPVVGWAMYLMGLIPLKRMDSRSQLECLKRCMDLVKKGGSVFFFPEGTRSKDGKLGAFKGAFSIAVKTGLPVVPITLIGTGKIMPAGREGIINNGSVKVVIHRPIQGNNPEELCNEARSIIAETLTLHG